MECGAFEIDNEKVKFELKREDFVLDGGGSVCRKVWVKTKGVRTRK
jgi:hypothetical protein